MGRPSSLRYVAFFVGGMLLAVYAIFFRHYDHITTEHAAYASLVVMLGALPSLVALVNKREAGLIPLMPLHGIFYAFTFGVPAFSNDIEWLAPSEDDITYALVLTILGLLCLYLGYYGFRGFFGKLKPIRTQAVPLKQQIRAAWILFGMYLAFQLFPALRALPSVGQLSAPLGYLSLGILTLLALGGQLRGWHLVFFPLAVLYALFVSVLSGSLAPAVFFLAFLGILLWNKKRRIPWPLIAVSVAVAVIFNPVKGQYRDVVWQAEQSSISYYDKLMLFGGILRDHYSGRHVSAITEDTTVINRLAHISTFGLVVNLTPAAVPYWSGDSYHTLWTSFIPRMLWPAKPQATIGQDFGHRYSLLGVNDYGTSINLPWLVEFYANFGTFGVLGGMFFVGVFFCFLVQKLRVPVNATMQHALAVTVVFGLFYAESNFALMVGGILSTYVAFTVLLRLLTRARAGAGSTQVTY